MMAGSQRLPITPASRPTWPNRQDQRYVVGWPSLDIIKIGSTMNGRGRWGVFLARGGQMIDLACYDSAVDAEVRLQDVVAQKYPRAFQSKEEARGILGNGGGGYLECYVVPVSDWATIARLALES